MNDFLEIGFWRQRQPHVERVLVLAESLEAVSTEERSEVERELAAAVAHLRGYDAQAWPRRSAAAPAVRHVSGVLAG